MPEPKKKDSRWERFNARVKLTPDEEKAFRRIMAETDNDDEDEDKDY